MGSPSVLFALLILGVVGGCGVCDALGCAADYPNTCDQASINCTVEKLFSFDPLCPSKELEVSHLSTGSFAPPTNLCFGDDSGCLKIVVQANIIATEGLVFKVYFSSNPRSSCWIYRFQNPIQINTEFTLRTDQSLNDVERILVCQLPLGNVSCCVCEREGISVSCSCAVLNTCHLPHSTSSPGTTPLPAYRWRLSNITTHVSPLNSSTLLVTFPRAPYFYTHSSDPHSSDPHLSDPHSSDPHSSDPHLSDPQPSDPHSSDPHLSDPHHRDRGRTFRNYGLALNILSTSGQDNITLTYKNIYLLPSSNYSPISVPPSCDHLSLDLPLCSQHVHWPCLLCTDFTNLSPAVYYVYVYPYEHDLCENLAPAGEEFCKPVASHLLRIGGEQNHEEDTLESDLILGLTIPLVFITVIIIIVVMRGCLPPTPDPINVSVKPVLFLSHTNNHLERSLLQQLCKFCEESLAVSLYHVNNSNADEIRRCPHDENWFRKQCDMYERIIVLLTPDSARVLKDRSSSRLVGGGLSDEAIFLHMLDTVLRGGYGRKVVWCKLDVHDVTEVEVEGAGPLVTLMSQVNHILLRLHSQVTSKRKMDRHQCSVMPTTYRQSVEGRKLGEMIDNIQQSSRSTSPESQKDENVDEELMRNVEIEQEVVSPVSHNHDRDNEDFEDNEGLESTEEMNAEHSGDCDLLAEVHNSTLSGISASLQELPDRQGGSDAPTNYYSLPYIPGGVPDSIISASARDRNKEARIHFSHRVQTDGCDEYRTRSIVSNGVRSGAEGLLSDC